MLAVSMPPVVTASYTEMRPYESRTVFMAYWKNAHPTPANVTPIVRQAPNERAIVASLDEEEADFRSAFLDMRDADGTVRVDGRSHGIKIHWTQRRVVQMSGECWFVEIRAVPQADHPSPDELSEAVVNALRGLVLRVEYTSSVDVGWRFQNGVWRKDGPGSPVGVTECVIEPKD